MKYLPILVLLFVAGCCTKPSESAKWKAIKDLTGEPLAAAIAKDSDPAFSELYERTRNIHLEVSRLEPESKLSEEKMRAYSLQKSLEQSFTQRLYDEALERKMAVWKSQNQK